MLAVVDLDEALGKRRHHRGLRGRRRRGLVSRYRLRRVGLNPLSVV